MNEQTRVFLWLYILLSAMTAFGLLFMVYGLIYAIKARGGTRNMLTGYMQKFYIWFMSSLAATFFFIMSMTAYRLVTGKAPSEQAGWGLGLFVVFTNMAVSVFVTGIRFRRATLTTLSLPDPLELSETLRVLNERNAALLAENVKHKHLEAQTVKILEDNMTAIRQVQEVLTAKDAS
jgi:hypothetical protein